MKLETLKRKLSAIANRRGHRLNWGAPYGRAGGPWSVSCKCRNCGMEGLASESPAPNGIDIGGQVVAMDCISSRAAWERIGKE